MGAGCQGVGEPKSSYYFRGVALAVERRVELLLCKSFLPRRGRAIGRSVSAVRLAGNVYAEPLLEGVRDEALVEAVPPEAAPGPHHLWRVRFHRQGGRGRRPVAVGVQVVGLDLRVIPAVDDLTRDQAQPWH